MGRGVVKKKAGGMMKKKGYSKGGTVRKGKRGMGAATRGGGAIMSKAFDPFEGRNWVNG